MVKSKAYFTGSKEYYDEQAHCHKEMHREMERVLYFKLNKVKQTTKKEK